MKQIEIFFDGFYLAFALSLGVRMFFMKGKFKNILSAMTFLLAFGDIFHLVPRILKSVGMQNLESFLNFGTKISSITMCIFYILFYIYIKKMCKINDRKLDIAVSVLGILRLFTIFINFKYDLDKLDLISNIPFVILGVIIVLLLYKNKDIFGKIYLYVIASFAFYIPVVLFKRIYPIVGALMIPKTIAYILMIISFYKSLDKNENPIKDISLTYLSMGFLSGVFYREFSKIFFESKTLLRIHPHLIILGFIVSQLIYVILNINSKKFEIIKKELSFYQLGIFLSFGTMFIKGIVENYTLNNVISKILIAISGLGHSILALSLIFIFKKILDENLLEAK